MARSLATGLVLLIRAHARRGERGARALPFHCAVQVEPAPFLRLARASDGRSKRSSSSAEEGRANTARVGGRTPFALFSPVHRRRFADCPPTNAARRLFRVSRLPFFSLFVGTARRPSISMGHAPEGSCSRAGRQTVADAIRSAGQEESVKKNSQVRPVVLVCS